MENLQDILGRLKQICEIKIFRFFEDGDYNRCRGCDTVQSPKCTSTFGRNMLPFLKSFYRPI